ncbi:WxL domain-containing protein [Vagococcus intermedius]|uniref:WxL domain-containing protein n=1 Tax=Vagococcus intermedius TaxID=2991418 RepID=A0AAF0CV77_9ENTE|nr:WxL domain-containing protein [Vagococcus intermedius]WEG73569.1 WxL domain-containing protein [Vagococcus intermedius]WEG75651.1 WxL domain-containing protein [Vagococcus intermedius]
MKKVVNALLVASIVLGGSALGFVANAEETPEKKDSKGSVMFDAGKLEFVTPKDKDGVTKEVPDFRFEKQKVGVANETIKQIKGSSDIAFAGLTDYTGTGKGWTVKLKASDFGTGKDKNAEPGYPETKSVSPSLTGMVITINNTVTDIFESGADAKGVENTAVAANGKEAVTIASAENGESEFLFDLSDTTLTIPAEDARKAQATADYTSDLTWTVEAGVDAGGQKGALPVK